MWARRTPCVEVRGEGYRKCASRFAVACLRVMCHETSVVSSRQKETITVKKRVPAAPKFKSHLPAALERCDGARMCHPVARCRTASKSVMMVAIATLSESAWPAMGMRTWASAWASQKSLRPSCSLPITIASGPRRSVSV